MSDIEGNFGRGGVTPPTDDELRAALAEYEVDRIENPCEGEPLASLRTLSELDLLQVVGHLLLCSSSLRAAMDLLDGPFLHHLESQTPDGSGEGEPSRESVPDVDLPSTIPKPLFPPGGGVKLY
jgi:hypothetical protein